MAKLIVTTVVRGSSRGESHGGLYLVNTESGQVLKPVDWNSVDIEWRGAGGDRGLRGIACHDDKVFVAASKEILVFNQAFELVDTYRNDYLSECHGLSVFGKHLFAAVAGNDTVLGLNLEEGKFDWAHKIASDGLAFGARAFDPTGDDGPLQVKKLNLNNVYCDKGGMYLSGPSTNAILKFGGRNVGVVATLPEGTRNARPFRDGLLFVDTEAGALRFESRNKRTALPIPKVAADKLPPAEPGASADSEPGFGRGLCVVDESLVAAGSTPASVAIYDLDEEKVLQAVNLSLDIRESVHSIAVWPYKWPTS